MSPHRAETPNRGARTRSRVLVALLAASALAIPPLASRLGEGGRTGRAAVGVDFVDSPTNLSNSLEIDAENPRLVVTAGGMVHVAWQELSDSSLGSDVFTRRRQPDGAWSPPAVLEYSAQQPALTTWDQDDVAAVYTGGYAETDGSLRVGIYLKRFDAAAQKWPLAGRAIPGGDGGIQPDLSFADGRLWLVWVDTSSGTRRTAWQSRLPSGTPAPRGSTFDGVIHNAQAPRIASASDGPGRTDLHVAWMDENDGASESWITHLKLPAAEPTPQVNPDLVPLYAQGMPRLPDLAARRRDQVCLAWQEMVPLPPPDRRQDIVRSCLPWAEARAESEAGRPASEPSIALGAEQGLILAWQQQSGGTPGAGSGIRYRQDMPPHMASLWEGDSSQPDLWFQPSTGEVHAVWLARPTGREDTDVFYARWRPPAPSPSPSASASPTASRTPSRTRTRTPSPTRTPFEETPTPGTPTPPTATTVVTPSATPASQIYCPYVEQRQGVGSR